MSYLTRAAAARAALKSLSTPFMTYFDNAVQVWYVRPVDLPLPIEALAWASRKDVHHFEWALVDSKLAPCMVVTCAEDKVGDVPEGWVVHPLDANSWRDPAALARPARAKSAIESPVAVVWRIAGEMVGAARKDVIAACVALGVNPSTAATQYHKWGKRTA
jgi:hypothetical protein